MNKPIVSIIIPVYKVEKYLRVCLNSIVSQTNSDWECILVDDGSPDGSGAICDEYVENDKRFRVYHNENRGASAARNYGLSKAQGKWIAFIDSDDYVLPEYISKMLNAISDNTDIVISNYSGRQKNIIILENVLLEGQYMIRYFIEKGIFALSAPYGKLYRHDVIVNNQIEFPIDIHMGEDMIFFVKYMNCIQSAYLVNSNEYIVRVCEGSLSTKYYSYASERACFEIWLKEIKKFIDGLSWTTEIKEKKIWETRTIGTFIRTIESLFKSNDNINLSKRLSLLNEINDYERSCFLKYYNPTRFSSKFMKFLFKYKLYIFFLILGSLHCRFNRLKRCA